MKKHLENIIFLLLLPLTSFANENEWWDLLNEGEEIVYDEESDGCISILTTHNRELFLDANNLGILNKNKENFVFNSINDLHNYELQSFKLEGNEYLELMLSYQNFEKDNPVSISIPVRNLKTNGEKIAIFAMLDLSLKKSSIDKKLVTWLNNLDCNERLIAGIVIATAGTAEAVIGTFLMYKGGALMVAGGAATIVLPGIGQLTGPVVAVLGIFELLVGGWLLEDAITTTISIGIRLIQCKHVDKSPIFHDENQ